jgi:hypothetical protein
MPREEPIAPGLLGLLFMGLGKADPKLSDPRPRPWLRVLASTALICILALPLCALMAWVWMYTKWLSFPCGLARALLLTVGPYFLWLAVVWCTLRCLAGRTCAKGAGALLDEASRFCVAYMLTWSLPVAWPFLMLFVWTVLLSAPRAHALGYYLFCGVPLLFMVLGLTLLLLGLKRATKGEQSG